MRGGCDRYQTNQQSKGTVAINLTKVIIETIVNSIILCLCGQFRGFSGSSSPSHPTMFLDISISGVSGISPMAGLLFDRGRPRLSGCGLADWSSRSRALRLWDGFSSIEGGASALAEEFGSVGIIGRVWSTWTCELALESRRPGYNRRCK